MSAFIGFSKNIGNGVRIGFALPVFSASKMGKREAANAQFVEDATGRIASALVNCLRSNGILVTAETAGNLGPAASGIVERLEPATPHIKSVNDAVRLYEDTGSIQQAGKEKIMRSVYEIERTCSENAGRSQLPQQVEAMRIAYARHNKRAKWALVLLAVALFPLTAGVSVLVALIFYAIKKKTLGFVMNRKLLDAMATAQSGIVDQAVSLQTVVTA